MTHVRGSDLQTKYLVGVSLSDKVLQNLNVRIPWFKKKRVFNKFYSFFFISEIQLHLFAPVWFLWFIEQNKNWSFHTEHPGLTYVLVYPKAGTLARGVSFVPIAVAPREWRGRRRCLGSLFRSSDRHRRHCKHKTKYDWMRGMTWN